MVWLVASMQPLNQSPTEQEENVYGRLEFQSYSNSCQLFLKQEAKEKTATCTPTAFFLHIKYDKVFALLDFQISSFR